MSKRTTIAVTLNGTPLVGAQVLVGNLLGGWEETDENGEVTFLTDDDFAATLPVTVRSDSLPQDAIFGCVLESGESEHIHIVNPV